MKYLLLLAFLAQHTFGFIPTKGFTLDGKFARSISPGKFILERSYRFENQKSDARFLNMNSKKNDESDPLPQASLHANLQKKYRNNKLIVKSEGSGVQDKTEKLMTPTLKTVPLMERSSFYYPDKVEVLDAMEPFVQTKVDEMLLETGNESWQPQDFLPDLTKPDWEEELKLFRKASEGLSDDLLVVLVGDMITEEALPTYQTLLNSFEGCDDPTGTSSSAWAQWSRGWTSEENRHGDLLNKYLYLTGRVDMRAIECTIQHLITDGFDPKAAKDPYKGFIYTSFQERATKISHVNVAKMARQQGDPNLSLICSKIGGDEARHEKAYQAFMTKIFELDPDGAMCALNDVLKNQITMPACLMTDGHENSNPLEGSETSQLFDKFSVTAQKTGVYTAIDYAEITQHLVDTWDLKNLKTFASPEAQKAQEYVCNLPDRYKRLADRGMKKVMNTPTSPFSWIYDREA